MSSETGMSGSGGGLRAMRRKAVETSELVTTSFLPEREGKYPIVLSPAVDNVDLAAWCESHQEQLDSYYDQYGAILFRGFEISTPEDFEKVASAITQDLFADYGDLPPESASQRIYGVTPYPPDKMILFHNESSHLPSWPMRQFFFCIVPSAEGGTTPLLDCREVLEALDPEIVEQFESKGLLYVRNFSEGIDVPWQDFFHTDDKAEVERQVTEAGMTCEWTENGLRVNQPSAGVRHHPRTGEKLFFNQVQLHHVSCLDEETRSALSQLFDDEDLPRNVYFGDGSPIPDELIDTISRTYEDLCVEFPWQPSDLVAVDNMLMQHARRPYAGERRILVAMGKMVKASDLAAAA
jgi:alpha-ketoglutarate-dependent taurine dioxygenase